MLSASLFSQKYSILMSVYAAVEPEHLRAAIDSMLAQTLASDDFILVCDGPLTPGLDRVIAGYQARYPGMFRVQRLSPHQGLVAALNAGLPLCRHELVARMDSDDVSHPQRCARQVGILSRRPELAILSGTVLEFKDTPCQITGKRSLPESHTALLPFSGKRSPFNHPAVMYRKSAVAAVGGYRNCFPSFEDHDLWVRMLRSGFRGENLREPLLFMRTGMGMYRRRGGRRYAWNLLRFHAELRRKHWSTPADFVLATLPHALACLLPTRGLALIYHRLHRKGENHGYPNPDRRHHALRPRRCIPGL